jgi:hypothetical protein
MTDPELQQLRREKWRLDGKGIRTIEHARAFIESTGFCLMFPQKPALLAPTFIGAFVGDDHRLPDWQRAYADPRAAEATELMVRLLRERSAYEANLFGENNAFLVAKSVFPYFYALVGERNPREAPRAGSRSPYSALACDAFALIQRDGPISKQKMREALGGSVSLPALDKALGELWSKLRITRVDYSPSESSSWDVTYRWAPEAVREGVNLSVAQALSALLSKYLECVVAVEQAELEALFSNFVPRSKMKDAVNALLGAREFSFVRVGARSMLQITPEKIVVVPVPGPAVRTPVWEAIPGVPRMHATRPDTRSKRIPDKQSETKLETKLETKPETRPATRSGTRPETRPTTRSGTRPATRSGTRPGTRSGTRSETRSGTRPGTRSGTRPEKRPSGKR